ncbi:proteoglycan 4-like [Adelges cooleyi]|uniref:proteoglycan 4-like n=1 Tax=Adelges cooleyi TaxID=133065 RepID=UPI00217F74F2|nr:proteoglycan 4-like [Adelges cooleyi]
MVGSFSANKEILKIIFNRSQPFTQNIQKCYSSSKKPPTFALFKPRKASLINLKLKTASNSPFKRRALPKFGNEVSAVQISCKSTAESTACAKNKVESSCEKKEPPPPKKTCAEEKPKPSCNKKEPLKEEKSQSSCDNKKPPPSPAKSCVEVKPKPSCNKKEPKEEKSQSSCDNKKPPPSSAKSCVEKKPEPSCDKKEPPKEEKSQSSCDNKKPPPSPAKPCSEEKPKPSCDKKEPPMPSKPLKEEKPQSSCDNKKPPSPAKPCSEENLKPSCDKKEPVLSQKTYAPTTKQTPASSSTPKISSPLSSAQKKQSQTTTSTIPETKPRDTISSMFKSHSDIDTSKTLKTPPQTTISSAAVSQNNIKSTIFPAKLPRTTKSSAPQTTAITTPKTLPLTGFSEIPKTDSTIKIINTPRKKTKTSEFKISKKTTPLESTIQSKTTVFSEPKTKHEITTSTVSKTSSIMTPPSLNQLPRFERKKSSVTTPANPPIERGFVEIPKKSPLPKDQQFSRIITSTSKNLPKSTKDESKVHATGNDSKPISSNAFQLPRPSKAVTKETSESLIRQGLKKKSKDTISRSQSPENTNFSWKHPISPNRFVEEAMKNKQTNTNTSEDLMLKESLQRLEFELKRKNDIFERLLKTNKKAKDTIPGKQHSYADKKSDISKTDINKKEESDLKVDIIKKTDTGKKIDVEKRKLSAEESNKKNIDFISRNPNDETSKRPQSTDTQNPKPPATTPYILEDATNSNTSEDHSLKEWVFELKRKNDLVERILKTNPTDEIKIRLYVIHDNKNNPKNPKNPPGSRGMHTYATLNPIINDQYLKKYQQFKPNKENSVQTIKKGQ